MRQAVIDLGTNTCLLLIVDWNPQQRQVRQILEDHVTVVRLGQGVDQTGKLDPHAMSRTLECLSGYLKRLQINGLDPKDSICVATSQARDAQNGAAFFEQIRQSTCLQFRVLSGDKEAHYTFLGGLLPGMDPKKHAVIDIGGGSTELMSQMGGKSLDIGSVRFTERYLKSNPVKDSEFWECELAIDQSLDALLNWRSSLPENIGLVGVAGTCTTLATFFLSLEIFDPKQIDGTILTRGDVHRMVEELKWRSIQEREQIKGVEKGRSDVLLAGSMILWRAMEKLNFPRVLVSTRGLRFGVLHLVAGS